MKRLAVVTLVCACAAPATAPAGPSNTRDVRATPLGKLLDEPVHAIVVAGDTLYATSGTGPLEISRDRGRTFAEWPLGQAVCANEVVAANNRVYVEGAACQSSIQTGATYLYRSDDAGRTWVSIGASNASLRAVDPRDPDVVYGQNVCGTTMCRSEDGGRTWDAIAVGLDTLYVGDDGTAYGTEANEAGTVVKRSTDHGETWQDVVSLHDSALAVGAVLADGSLLALSPDLCEVDRLPAGAGKLERGYRVTEACSSIATLHGEGHTACVVFANDVVATTIDNAVHWRTLDLGHAAFGHADIDPSGQGSWIESNARYACVASADRLLIAADDGLYALPW